MGEKLAVNQSKYTRKIYRNIVFHNNRADRIREICYLENKIIDKNLERVRIKSKILDKAKNSEFNVLHYFNIGKY